MKKPTIIKTALHIITKNKALLFPIFCIGYTLISLSTFANTIVFIENLIPLFNVSGIILIGVPTICWMLIERKPEEFICFFVFMVLSFLSYYYGGTTLPLKLNILLFAAQHVKLTKCIKIDFLTKLFIVISVATCYALGLTNVDVMFRGDETARYSFGFSHPNTFAIITTMLVAELFYLTYHKKNSKLTCISIAVIVGIINYLCVDSRASLLLLVAIITIYIIPQSFIRRIFKMNRIQKILSNIFPICLIVILCLIISFNFKWAFSYEINSALSGRIRLYNAYLVGVNIKLFGTNINSLIREAPLDSLYMMTLIRYGIVLFIIYAAIAKKTIENLLTKQNHRLLAILVATLIYGIMESVAIMPNYNIFILAFGYGLESYIDKTKLYLTAIQRHVSQFKQNKFKRTNRD